MALTEPEVDDSPQLGVTDLGVTDVGAHGSGLHAGLSQLAFLMAGAVDLPELLAQVAVFAVATVPGADGAGVIVLPSAEEAGGMQASAFSAGFVRGVDMLQFALQEGPCITAARARRTVRSGSLGGSQLWPRFGPRMGRGGVHSALALPLLLPDQVVGVINVYARARDAFDDDAARSGELFARSAAVAVHNASMMAQAQLVTRQLQTALTSRPVINQAIGILRGRSGGTTEEALARLKTISQNEHTKLAVVAQRLVDEAVRRAHARPDWLS